MSNLKLSDAAAAILSEENAESILNKSRQAGGEKFGLGKSKVSADEQGESDLGTAGHKSTDPNYDAAKDIKQATLPTGKGVSAEPMKKLASQPGDSAGRKDLAVSPEGSETSEEGKVNRKKGPVAKPTTSANAGATKPYVPESEDEEEFEDEEASEEEVLDDLENMEESVFAEKYGMGKKEAVEYMYEAKSCDSSDDEEDEDEEDEKEAKAKMSEKNKEKMKEDIDAMLSGENLSEEFKLKATTIFEAAVQSRVDEVASELEEQFTNEFESALESVKEDFANKLDSYLDYVVENWMEENSLAVEKGLRTEIAEDFIGALRNVFVEHYIDIPNEKEDIVEGLVEKVEDLESKINEEISKNINLKQQIAEHKKHDIIHSVCEGLTLSQVEKIKSLAENVEFVSDEDFGRKLSVIKESYFPSGIIAAKSDALNEPVELDEDTSTKVVDPLIEAYAKTISKSLKF
jgi:hypothetical protein